MYGSASPRMRAFSAARGLCEEGEMRGAFMRTPPILPKKLLDGDLLARCRGLLRQRQLEHAVAELGFGPGLVHFLRQREAARHLAERALGMQHALVLGHFL